MELLASNHSPHFGRQAEIGGISRLDLDDPRWSALVDADRTSLPFHRSPWPSFIAHSYRFSGFVLALTGSDGQLVAGLPVVEVRSLSGSRRWVALPFTDACGPVVHPSFGADILGRLEAELEQARVDAGIARVEVRAALPGEASTSLPSGVLHRLTLGPDPDAVAQLFRPNVRQGIRAAEKAGVSVRWGESSEDLTHVFYDLHLRTRRRLGVPVQGRRYFRLLWERVLAPGNGFTLIASYEGTPVAAAVFLTGGNTIVYKYGASDERAWRLRPNNRLFAEAIRWGCTNGCLTFDFGRSDFEAEGLRRFKASWGAKETPLTYSALGSEPSSRARHRVLAAVARTTLRRSPQAACRAAGLLYRWAA